MLPAVICRFSTTAHYTYAGSLSHEQQITNKRSAKIRRQALPTGLSGVVILTGKQRKKACQNVLLYAF